MKRTYSEVHTLRRTGRSQEADSCPSIFGWFRGRRPDSSYGGRVGVRGQVVKSRVCVFVDKGTGPAELLGGLRRRGPPVSKPMGPSSAEEHGAMSPTFPSSVAEPRRDRRLVALGMQGRALRPTIRGERTLSPVRGK